MQNSFEGLLLFRFEGIVALCVKRGKEQFDAAIVKDTRNETGEIEDHAHSIEIIKWKDKKKQESAKLPFFDYRNPARLLRLDLDKGSGSPPPKGIQFYLFGEDDQTGSASAYGFNRNIAFCFDWVVDATNDRRAGRVNDKALRTRLRVTGIEDCLFIPGAIRATPASLVNPYPSSRFWGVAESVNAIVRLKGKGAKLRKFNAQGGVDGQWPLPKEKGVNYEIIVKNTCEDKFCSVDTRCIYNNLINQGHECEEEIEFSKPSNHMDIQIDHLLNPHLPALFKSAGPLICPSMNFSGLDELPDPALPGA
jgi:hypothetical protein